MMFRFSFEMKDDDTFKILKEYNQILGQKKYLERLEYSHDRIDAKARTKY